MPMSHFTPWGWGSLLVSIVFLAGCLSSIFLRAYCNSRRRRCRARAQRRTRLRFPEIPVDPIADLDAHKADPEYAEELCSICFDPFADLDVAVGEHCNHMFHSNCIEAWLAKDVTHSCPLCRATFGSHGCGLKELPPV